jgi:hypothetical protein
VWRTGAVLAPLAVATAVLVARALLAERQTVDDLFIFLRYARTLAENGEFAFNRGQHVEGTSSVAWTIALAALWKAGLRGAGTAKLASLVVGACIPAVTWLAIRRAVPGKPLAAAVAVVALSLDADLAAWSTSGMDTPVWALACIGCVAIAASRERSTACADCAACALGALAWIRPEGPLFAVAGIVASSRSMRDALRFCLWAAAPLAVLTLLRVAYFHDVVPNTFWAKMHSVDGKDYTGLGYLANALERRPLLLVASPIFAWFFARKGPVVRLALALFGASLLFPVVAGGDWMPNRRLFVASLPLGALVAASSLAAIRYPPAAAIVAAGLVLEPALTFDHAVDQTWRDNEWVDERLARWIPSGRPFADPYPLDWMPTHFLGELAPYVGPGDVIAHVDVGELPYVMSDVAFLDGFGLVDRTAGTLAFFPGDPSLREAARSEFFIARPASAIVVFDETTGHPFSPSQRAVLEDPRFAAGWRELGRVPTWGKHPCVTYVRRDVQRADDRIAHNRREAWLSRVRDVAALP